MIEIHGSEWLRVSRQMPGPRGAPRWVKVAEVKVGEAIPKLEPGVYQFAKCLGKYSLRTEVITI